MEPAQREDAGVQVMSDKQLRQEILDVFQWDQRSKLAIENGVVTLTGRSKPRMSGLRLKGLAGVYFDAFLASNDGKFAYWYLRPNQLDPSITPLFPVPPFPSYPSNHSTLSTARCEVLAYLFPAHAQFIRTVGKEAGDSRIWAGIHYEIPTSKDWQRRCRIGCVVSTVH
jgi:hypothetical protein